MPPHYPRGTPRGRREYHRSSPASPARGERGARREAAMTIQTLCDIFYHSVDTYRKPQHLMYRKDGRWNAISSDELRAAVEEISMGLTLLGVGKGDRVAILSENRPEWAFADLATLATGAADAP